MSINILSTHKECIELENIKESEFKFCKEQIKKLNLDMKLIQVNYLKKENKLIFFFTAPERVDFRELLKILREKYYKNKIELRQIGQRDAASLLGGIGICGREICCRSFIRKFQTITAKTAKRVCIIPNPTIYCGVCGRLRCCLKFEPKEDIKRDKK